MTRTVNRLSVLMILLTLAGCNCFAPTSPTATTPQQGGNPFPTGDATTVVALSVEGATTVQVGSSVAWQAVALLSNGTQRTVTTESTWTTASSAVATLSGSGRITGVTPGQSAITAAYAGLTASGMVTVVAASSAPPTVLGLTIEGATTLHIGSATQLQAIAQMSDGSSMSVTTLATWASDTTTIATVTGGTVVGLAAGAAPIRASYAGRTASVTMTVTGGSTGEPTVLGLTISGNTVIQVGQTTQLQATAQMSNGSSINVTATAAWSSSATNVAVVQDGLVTGVGAGTAPIQASYQGKVATAGVVVSTPATPPPTVVSLAIQGSTSIQVGQTTQLQAVATLSDGTTQTVTGSATWSSASASVATVAAGLVTGQAAGTAAISASHAGRSAQVTVTVSAPAPTKVLTGLEANADVNLTQVLLNQAFHIQVLAVYSDGSKVDVTSVAVVAPDSPSVHHDTPGTLAVVMTLADALLDPTHVVNVQYGGFTTAVTITLQLPVIQSLQLGTGGTTSVQLGSQLPAVTGLFSGGAQASFAADYPGLSWNLQPRGTLGTILGLLGLNLNQVLTVADGQIVAVSNGLLAQVVGLAGSTLPIDLRATYSGVTSNVMQANLVTQ